MARALMGHVGSSNDHLLAYEVGRLRRRVAELEAELSDLREHHTQMLDVELHRMAEGADATAVQPALA